MLQLTLGERVEALLFLLLGLGLTVLIAVFLLGLAKDDPRAEYFIEFEESISGIDENTRVLFQGVPCGRVKDISLSDEMAPPVIVKVELDTRITITGATRARIALSSILGRMHIELENSGEDDLPSLTNQILAEPSKLSEFVQTGESLAEKLVDALNNVVNLTSESRQQEIFSAVQEFRLLAQDLRTQIPVVTNSLTATTSSLEQTSNDIRRVVLTNERDLNEAVVSLRTSMQHIETFLARDRLSALADTTEQAIRDTQSSLDSTLKRVESWLESNNLEDRIEPYLKDTVGSVAQLTKRLTVVLDRIDREGVDLLRAGMRPALVRLNEVGRGLVRLIALIERQPRALLFGESQSERPLPRRGGTGNAGGNR